MPDGFNTSNEPLTETIIIDKDITVDPNGMYLVSSAPAIFAVVEGGKLTIMEGPFTIKNTTSNGAAVFVDGGEFVMGGGSFDVYTAMKTAEGKSSVVTLAAGWSNRVTVGIDSYGDDTINVTGGTLISSKESIITRGTTTINMSGGTLNGKPSSASGYQPSVKCQGPTTFNMTGGTITTSGDSTAVNVYHDSTVNLSGSAVITGVFAAIQVGSAFDRDPSVNTNNIINISGGAKVSCSGIVTNARIGYAVFVRGVNSTVNVSGNATIIGPSYGVYAGGDGNAIHVSDNAYIKVSGGADGYGVGAPVITVTGGRIEATLYGVINDFDGGTVVIDNSESHDDVVITGGRNDIYLHSVTGTDFTVATYEGNELEFDVAYRY